MENNQMLPFIMALSGAGGGGGSESDFIHALSHTTKEGYEIPVLTDEQITQAYNDIIAGKNVYIVDDLDTITIQVLDASSIDSPDISISMLFNNTLLLKYTTGGEINAIKIPITASDIKANNLQTVQQNLERIDERINDVTIQYTSMPTASADNLGIIIQFTGTTTSTFTNGQFYKCISDGATEPTYSWQKLGFATEQYVDNAIGNAIEGEY